MVVLGNFDGFHRGHQAVVTRARTLAQETGRPLIVATFDPHPVRFFRPDTPPFRLTSLDQRERLFAAAGADAMLVFGFDATLATVTPEEFVADRIAARTGASMLVTGQDFTFGKARAGNVSVLADLGARHGIATEAVGAVSDAHGPISSSRIRDALVAGDCRTAEALLTRPYAIEGMVQHGDKLGQQLGYPTANMEFGAYLRPAFGVYAVRATLGGGERVEGVANLGVRPMIDPPRELIEPYFFDFAGDLYGQTIEVELVHYLRPEAKFDGLDALKDGIARDCMAARALLAATARVA